MLMLELNCIVHPYLGVGNGKPLQYSCLENPMDRGARQASVHGITRSLTRLSVHTHTCPYLPCHLPEKRTHIFCISHGTEFSRDAQQVSLGKTLREGYKQ